MKITASNSAHGLQCHTVIIKVSSLCNLNCSYCYMYNLGDKTYRNQPKIMANSTVDWLLIRIRDHCRQHNIGRFHVVFHGGEPLLAPPVFYQRFVAEARRIIGVTTRLSFSLQTNATLLTNDWCAVLGPLQIQVGISLDGNAEAHDQFRRDHRGRGSYEAVRRGIDIARQSPHLKHIPGLLSVINLNADPVSVYHHLAELGLPDLDFALPDAHHDLLPLGLQSWPDLEQAPFADWLIRLFDAWYAERPARTTIRIFDQIMGLIMGIDNGFEYFGQRRNEFLLVETNGSIEPVGTLKACGNGFTKVGANVHTHSLEDALTIPLMQLYHLSHEKLAPVCRQCAIREVCGGGFLPHRFSHARGFDNPSVYCQDLQRLITHIQNRMLLVIPADVVQLAGLVPLHYNTLRQSTREAIARLNV